MEALPMTCKCKIPQFDVTSHQKRKILMELEPVPVIF